MPESTIKPDEIHIDGYNSGIANILVRWNIAQETRIGESAENEQSIWTYNEARLNYACPYIATDGITVLDSEENILKYLIDNKTEILNNAKGTTVSLIGKDKVPVIKSKSSKDSIKDHDKKDTVYTIKGNR